MSGALHILPLASAGTVLSDVTNVVAAILFLALVALGLWVIFGMMRVINMAHGELFMLGAFTAWWFETHGLGFWASLVVAPLLVGALGIVIERLIIRPLYGRGDLSTLLATAGISIILQRAIALWFGARAQSVTAPVSGNFSLLGQPYVTYKVIAMGLAVAVIVGTFALFRFTGFGLRARATIENPAMAEVFGTNASRMNMASFALGAALAGFAGALVAPLISVVPTMGLDFVVRSFLVVIVGGTGGLFGALGGSTLIGGADNALTLALSGTLADILVLALAMLLVLVRPRGIFGRGDERT